MSEPELEPKLFESRSRSWSGKKKFWLHNTALMWGMEFKVPKCTVMLALTLMETPEEKDAETCMAESLKPLAVCQGGQVVLGHISCEFHSGLTYVHKTLQAIRHSVSGVCGVDRVVLHCGRPRLLGEGTEKSCRHGVRTKPKRVRGGGDPKELGLSALTEVSHQTDMQMVHKIMRVETGLYLATWFEKAADSGPATTLAADPFKWTVQRDRFGWKWYQSIDLSLNVRRRDFQLILTTHSCVRGPLSFRATSYEYLQLSRQFPITVQTFCSGLFLTPFCYSQLR
jgi:hypothetical protein